MANPSSLIAFVGLFAYVQCELFFQPIEEQASKLNADPFYGLQEPSPLIDVDFETFEQQNQVEKVTFILYFGTSVVKIQKKSLAVELNNLFIHSNNISLNFDMKENASA